MSYCSKLFKHFGLVENVFMKITTERVSRVKLLKQYFLSLKTQAGDPRVILHLGVETQFFSEQGKQTDLRQKTVTATVGDFILTVNVWVQKSSGVSVSCL